MTDKILDRHISQLTRNTLALILAGGQGSRLRELTEWRAKPAVHFGGKFRIIDFPLSNCVNSGIRRIGILTQYKAHSLIKHLVQGWSHFRPAMGEVMEVLPASQRMGGEWYKGTADALYQNLDILRTHAPDYVLILSGDHIYKQDYGTMIAAHVESGADMTISCLEVPLEEAAGAYGVMTVNEQMRIVGFDEKPAEPTPIPGSPELCLASMGNYVFSTEFLFQALINDADTEGSSRDFGNDIIPSLIDSANVFAYPFRGPEGQRAYWRDVGNLDAFWLSNMELLDITPELNLYDKDWPILTDQAQLPPAKFIFNDEGRRGIATDSMVSGGCLISGAALDKSLLFSNVRVNSYAKVEETVVLPSVNIGRGAKICRAILDRGCDIPEDMEIGYDHEADRARGFRVSDGGIVLVTPSMLGQSTHMMR
ncbi:MAG: glucose-1-phosphate adenylyltransferase [Gammaproteobacteria bacterium]